MHKRKIILRDIRGFSLVSVLVGSFILTVGILALVRIFSTTPIVNVVTDRISRSTNYAQDKIEKFRTLGYNSLETAINANDTTGIDTIGHIIREYRLSFYTFNTIRVEVRCFWRPLSAGGGREVKLVTLVSRHN